MLTDSHAHLDMSEFDKDREHVLERARSGGVGRVITIGVDLQTSIQAVELAKKYDFVFSTVGFHPHNAKDFNPKDLDELCRMAEQPRVVAWGEIGLDFFRLYSPAEEQRSVFEKQLELASQYDLPVVIHDRDAHDEIFSILKKRQNPRQRGVIHCFSSNYRMAMEFINMGFYISLPGTVTYKNALDLHEVAARVPMERLLVETDAPFLTPVPMRGKRNEPLFVSHTARRIAELRGMDFDEFSRRTNENTTRLFRLGLEHE